MAKKTKRMLALAMVFILCVGQLTMVAVATEEENTQPIITITPIENGMQTVTVTSQTTEDNGIFEIVDTTLTEKSQTVMETIPAGTAGEDGFTMQGGTQTTEVESTETKTEVEINNGPEYPIFESEKIEGEETTTITSTQTETKKTSERPEITTTDNDFILPETEIPHRRQEDSALPHFERKRTGIAENNGCNHRELPDRRWNNCS